MGRRKGGLASIFFTSRHSSKPSSGSGTATSPNTPSPPWPWPSCATKPQTPSFRGHDGNDPPCTTTAPAAGRRFTAAPPGAGGGGGRLRPPRGAALLRPGDEMYKTVNSVYLDAAADSCRFSFFDDDHDGGVLDFGSFSTTTASEEWSEAVIRSSLGRTSTTDRFFFDGSPDDPITASNSILAASPSPSPGRTRPLLGPPPLPPPPPVEEAPIRRPQTALPSSSASASAGGVLLSESDDDDAVSEAETEVLPMPAASTSSLVEASVAVALDSEDPFRDFRASMHEMVAAHGLRDWAALREMLLWYLRVNAKRNHSLIVGAFVDLLVGLASSSIGSGGGASPSATTTATMTTTTTTACCCCSSSSSTSSSSSSSSSTSSAGGVGVATNGATAAGAAAATMDEQCGGGISAGASCSSAASSDLEEQAAAAGEV